MANYNELPKVGDVCKYLLRDEVDDIFDAKESDWTECKVKYSYVNKGYKGHSFIVAECNLYGYVTEQPLILQDTYFKSI